MTVDIAEMKRLVEWIKATDGKAPMGLLIDCLFFVENNAKAIIEELGAGRDMCEIIMRDHQKLHAENARLRATLEWYAQKGIVCTLEVLHSPYLIADNGKRAREALGGDRR